MFTIMTDGQRAFITGEPGSLRSLQQTIEAIVKLLLAQYGRYIGLSLAHFLGQLEPDPEDQPTISIYWPFLLVDLLLWRQIPLETLSKRDRAVLLWLDAEIETALLNYEPELGQACLDWLQSYRLDIGDEATQFDYLLEFIWYRTIKWATTYRPGKDSFRRLPVLLRGFKAGTPAYQEFWYQLDNFPDHLEPGEMLARYSTDSIMSRLGLKQLARRKAMSKPKYNLVVSLLNVACTGALVVYGKAPTGAVIDQYEFQATGDGSARRAGSQWFNRTYGPEQRFQPEDLASHWWPFTASQGCYQQTRRGLLVMRVIPPDNNPILEQFIDQVRQEAVIKSDLETIAEFVWYRMQQHTARLIDFWHFPTQPGSSTLQELDLLYDLAPHSPPVIAEAVGIELSQLNEWLGRDDFRFRCPVCNFEDRAWGSRCPGGYEIICPYCQRPSFVEKYKQQR